jgi:hypothetical protein
MTNHFAHGMYAENNMADVYKSLVIASEMLGRLTLGTHPKFRSVP